MKESESKRQTPVCLEQKKRKNLLRRIERNINFNMSYAKLCQKEQKSIKYFFVTFLLKAIEPWWPAFSSTFDRFKEFIMAGEQYSLVFQHNLPF